MWGISTQESSEGAEKQQTAAPNGFSLFVMRLLLLPLPEHVLFLGGWMQTRMERRTEMEEYEWCKWVDVVKREQEERSGRRKWATERERVRIIGVE